MLPDGLVWDAPGMLLLAIPVALLPLLRWQLAQRRPGRRFSSSTLALAAAPSLRRRLLWLPSALLSAALLLLVVALARPQQGLERVVDVNRGVAIELVVDRSGSMGELMTRADGSQASRLQVVKEMAGLFVSGDGQALAGRSNDLVGLVTFARYPDTVMPLTLSHDSVAGFLDSVRLVTQRQEDGTALGDALALAAARLRRAEEELSQRAATDRPAGGADAVRGTAYEIKSKVIVVLTDGRNNVGSRAPLQAAQLAAEWGIKIYAIGIGNAAAGGGDSLFRALTQRAASLDMPTLEALAEATGGLAREVTDANALREVYREIDRLEKSEVQAVRYLSRRERFVPLVIAALALLVVAALIEGAVLRRSP